LVRGAEESKTICRRKRPYRLEKGGGLEGFHTYIHLRGRVGGIYLARDI